MHFHSPKKLVSLAPSESSCGQHTRVLHISSGMSTVARAGSSSSLRAGRGSGCIETSDGVTSLEMSFFEEVQKSTEK